MNNEEDIEFKKKRIERDVCGNMTSIAEFFVGLASLFAILQYVYLFANPPIALSITPSGAMGFDANGSPYVITPAITFKNLGTEVPIRFNIETANHTSLYAFKLYGSESPDLIIHDDKINSCGFSKWYNKGALVFPGSEVGLNLLSVCLSFYPGYQRYELYSNISITYSNANFDNVMKSCEYTATFVSNTGTRMNYPINEKNICYNNIGNVIRNEKYVFSGLIIVLILVCLFYAYKESKLKK